MNKAEEFGTVDLTNCDREPIHLLGAIQPVGFLLALSTDWMVARCSANIGEFFDTSPDDLIGSPASQILSGDAIHSLRNRLALLRSENAIERLFNKQLSEASEQRFDVAIHMSDGQIIVEGEPSSEKDYGDATGTVRSMMVRLDDAEDMDAFFREGARQIRALTGFDRVMVYRFDEDGSGEVVAEAARNGIGSFLGLHYPPSDIPKQARALYLRSLLRVITDIDAEPVPILPEQGPGGKPLDLSLSVLRAVSPIHIEYLRNMGVSSSMSISIVVEGELWGLIACHHYTPRCPSFERRSVAELFAQLFAMRIETRERKEIAAYERRARDVSDRLLGAVASDEGMLKDPDWLADIITDAIPADGVGVWINGSYAFSGQTPDTEQFARIIRTLNTTAAGEVFATDHIASILPSAREESMAASGLLSIPISRVPRDYVVLFRGERVRSMRWAGNPEKPIEYGPNGARLTPRESFAEWKQLVEGRSIPWTDSELRVADTLRATLIEVVLRMSDEANQERKAASDRQEVLIAELNHRVRNILSLIRGLIRQSKPEKGTSVEEFVSLIDGRVHALARAHNQITDEVWGPARFRQLIDAEIAAFLDKQKDQVDVHGEPVLLKPQAYSTMALVIHELVTNSAKYGSLSTKGRVDISWQRDDEGNLLIDWIEKDGPKVTPPKRKGFGTTIIGHSVPYDLGGKAALNYHQDGLQAHFVIPAHHVSIPTEAERDAPLPPMTSSRPGAPKEPVDSTLLNGKDVLLVEDSLIIALDAEDILERLGARSVVTEATVDGALAAIDRKLPSFALLDINLGDRFSFAIADVLEKKGVPFLFATGYGAQAKMPEKHAGRTVMQKPYTLESMSRRLKEFLR
ncbi:HWE histidine kinase domain-containing protein [Sphingomicrobium lutaoense]|uniref:histidine kinase n=1 Tax=Sphingomicrobium lutaoense TaxID=515949 RepID=A0A839YY47_9SPHN|nr:HWE histidine kinase domain-containing protein [Sphingomicrobium lutaoense]MBB3764079.1 light-regulated signal transduction histidine kinase (bacteriophytochrome)/CheY-like chemotaxis protein [Sphingomicrobium lutaoense]